MSNNAQSTKLESTTKITLDVAKADWLLNQVQTFVGDRTFRPSHVEYLVTQMKGVSFMTEQTQIAVCKVGKDIYRLNGQHTARAVLKCNEEGKVFSLRGVTLLTYVAKSVYDMRKLYARIDRGASRTNRNVTKSILVGEDGFTKFSERILSLLPAGLAMMKHESVSERRLYAGESAALDVQGEYSELSKAIGAFMSELNHSPAVHGHMFRAPVVASLYATFAVDAEDAYKFWKSVATGVGFESENEPASRLNRTLQNTSVGGGHVYRGSKKSIGTEEMYRVSLFAWNRYREHGFLERSLQPAALKSRPEAK